jgi:hypothetical protein
VKHILVVYKQGSISRMTFALVMAGCMILGGVFAEVVHRIAVRRMRASQLRNALVAEYVDKQLWQFVSLDEWLRGPHGKP